MDFIVPRPNRLWKSKADFFRPFRTAATLATSSTFTAGENIVPLYDPHLHQDEFDDRDLRDLNHALTTLIDLFPDIQPEVFREMLSVLGEESRLQVVTEHLLQRRSQWVQGRTRVPAKPSSSPRKVKAARKAGESIGDAVAAEPVVLADEDRFRSEAYRKAVKQVLYLEFKALSHSTVKAVLAEHNFSYTLARPVLQGIWTKSWRQSFSNFLLRRTATVNAGEHPFVLWDRDRIVAEVATPVIKRTGSVELDAELHELFVAPVVTKQRASRLLNDATLANNLNNEEAETTDSMFDCECCYTSASFEEIAICDDGCHVLCLDCVQRVVREALYGQGWARTIHLPRATVRCFAPGSDDCEGCISVDLLKRALARNDTEGDGLWPVFESRIVNENMTQSRLELQRCPFCTYAEVNELSAAHFRHPSLIWNHFTANTSTEARVNVALILLASPLLMLPILVLCGIVVLALILIPSAKTAFHASRQRISKFRRGLKFRCRNISCAQVSCMRCSVIWQDPHSCFDNEATSLRTAIESSATAAVKRTCPKCMLSFVKSSGCNKLVCNCGYTMCYICRQEITSREGYMHFCQHFRPNGGRCDECDRCDLYGDEDEAKAIQEAAKEAERIWREQQGQEGQNPAAAAMTLDALVGQRDSVSRLQMWTDFVVDAILA